VTWKDEIVDMLIKSEEDSPTNFFDVQFSKSIRKYNKEYIRLRVSTPCKNALYLGMTNKFAPMDIVRTRPRFDGESLH